MNARPLLVASAIGLAAGMATGILASRDPARSAAPLAPPRAERTTGTPAADAALPAAFSRDDERIVRLFSALQQPVRLRQRFELFEALREITAAELPALMKHAESLPRDAKSELVPALAERWFELDPRAAEAWAVEAWARPSGNEWRTMQSWARADPDGAFRAASTAEGSVDDLAARPGAQSPGRRGRRCQGRARPVPAAGPFARTRARRGDSRMGRARPGRGACGDRGVSVAPGARAGAQQRAGWLGQARSGGGAREAGRNPADTGGLVSSAIRSSIKSRSASPRKTRAWRSSGSPGFPPSSAWRLPFPLRALGRRKSRSPRWSGAWQTEWMSRARTISDSRRVAPGGAGCGDEGRTRRDFRMARRAAARRGSATA